MKIEVYFRDALLGELEKREDGVYYTSSDNEISAVKQYLLLVSPYNSLIHSNNNKIEKDNEFFAEMVENIKRRKDLIENAKIDENDDDFMCLYKYSLLLQSTHKFHFKGKI